MKHENERMNSRLCLAWAKGHHRCTCIQLSVNLNVFYFDLLHRKWPNYRSIRKKPHNCLTLGSIFSLSFEWEKKPPPRALSIFQHTNVNTWHIKISFFNLIFIVIDSNMLYLLLSFPNCALKLTHKSLSKSSMAINPTAVRFSLITNELLSCHRIAWAECLTD